MPSPAQLRWFVSCVVMLFSAPVAAQVSFEEPPIDYHKAPLSDPISHLQKKLDASRAELEFDKKHGYLPSLLEQLGVKVSSQVLVFSKTSFQLRKISPRTPRAVYFSDEMYIGTVQGGDVLEISSVDPQQGAIFYALDQRKTLAPKFKRLTHQCIQCHASSMTEGVPGHMVRSVYTRPDGQPVYSAGTFRTDQSSPLHQRWGGWYVTGTHGRQRHMGNLLVRKQDDPEKLNLDPGANVTDLKSLVDTSPYLSRHSDIAALMVLEHQGKMHNLITKANFQARIARQNSDVMNKALSRPAGYESPITKRLYTSGGDRMLKYMLFSDEIKLEDSIVGSGAFTKEFAAQGPHDSKGRSLRDLDLKTRLMKYPCSYLIYGKGFDGLPKPVLRHVYRRLWEILTGKDTSDEFAHLSASDRQAILEILLETKPGLPDYWKKQ